VRVVASEHHRLRPLRARRHPQHPLRRPAQLQRAPRQRFVLEGLVNTLYFTAVGGPLTLVVALASALLVNTKVARWKPLFRTIYFAPVVTTIVAVAVVWKYLYHPRYGSSIAAWI